MDASTAADQYGALSWPGVVIVNRPTKRLKRGGIHAGSRDAIIRQARRENPRYATAAAVEVWYGDDDSRNTVVRFDPALPVHAGL